MLESRCKHLQRNLGRLSQGRPCALSGKSRRRLIGHACRRNFGKVAQSGDLKERSELSTSFSLFCGQSCLYSTAVWVERIRCIVDPDVSSASDDGSLENHLAKRQGTSFV